MGNLEQVLRELIREELAGIQGVPTAHSLTASTIGAAVKAEAARAGKHHSELANVLGVSRPTITGRLSGAYEFKRGELEKIASFLGLTTHNILESAALGQRFAVAETTSEGQESVHPPGTWAQPPRALAAQRRRAEGRRPGPH